MGGAFGGIHFLKEWADYFPRRRGAAPRYHKKLDALQGKRRTVMVGEVFNLPLVSGRVDWARYVVRREFPRVAEGPGSANVAVAPHFFGPTLELASLDPPPHGSGCLGTAARPLLTRSRVELARAVGV